MGDRLPGDSKGFYQSLTEKPALLEISFLQIHTPFICGMQEDLELPVAWISSTWLSLKGKCTIMMI